MALRIALRAAGIGITAATAKKPTCITVLMVCPRPCSWAMAEAFRANTRRPLAWIWACTRAGMWGQQASGGQGLLSSSVAPGAASSSRLNCSRKSQWWQATSWAWRIR